MNAGLAVLVPLTLRNLRRRGLRTALTAFAIALAIGAMIPLSAFMQAWLDGAFEREINALTGHGQIHALGYLEDPSPEIGMDEPSGTLLDALNSPAVLAWTSRVVSPALVRSERESAPVMLYGVDPGPEGEVSFFGAEMLGEGEMLADAESDGIILGADLADRLQTRLGRRVVLTAQDAAGDIAEAGLPVVGLYGGHPELQKRVAFASLETARSLFAMGDRISEISYLVSDIDTIHGVTGMLRKADPNLAVSSWDELRPLTKAMVELHASTNLIWVVASFILVSIGLVNTLMLAVHERMREFSLMRALGMGPHFLLMQVLLESLVLLVLGALLGVAAGAAIVGSYADGLDLGAWAEGSAYFGGSQVLRPRLDYAQVAFACGAVMALSLAASLYPAWKASKATPVDALTRAET